MFRHSRGAIIKESCVDRSCVCGVCMCLYADFIQRHILCQHRIPWWWHPESVETRKKETMRRLCLIFRRAPKIAKKKKLLLASPFLSVRMEQLGSHWTDFHEIWGFFAKIQVSLKSDKNSGYFTWRSINIFDHISNATNAHTGCGIAFPLQQWLH